MESETDVTLSPTVIPDLIDLVKDPKFEVKKGALALILQFCTLPAHRKLFETSELLKLLLRSVPVEGLETISLSNLISFSQDDWACSQIYELNGFDRLIEFLSTISKERPNDSSTGLMVELSLLLISNLTQNKEGVLKFLHYEQKEHLARNLIFLFERVLDPKYREMYKFVGNVFSNVTAVKEAREILISPDFKLIHHLLSLTDSQIKEIRSGSLHAARNLSFEYESAGFFDQIIDEKARFVDIMSETLAKITIHSENVDSKLKTELQKLVKVDIVWKSVVFSEEIAAALDILLVLTNVPEIDKKLKFEAERLGKILGIIKQAVNEELKDKIDVILCVLCLINPMNP